MELGVMGWIFIISVVVYFVITLVTITSAKKKGRKLSRRAEILFSVFTIIGVGIFFIFKISQFWE